MDLIQMYHDQESQSSSSCEEPIFVDRIENAVSNNTPQPKIAQRSSQRQQQQQQQQSLRSPPPRPQQQHNGTNGRQLQRHLDKSPKNQSTNFAQWMIDIDKRVHSCLGSLTLLPKNTILESMDYFISKLTKDYNKLIKPKIAEHLSNYIRTYLYVYRYLYRSFEMGKRYFKRIIKIVAIYTDMELCASIRGTEYDAAIAERIQFIYQTHLLASDQNMVLDVLLNMKRLWRRHRGILNLLLQHFLILTEPVEFSDLLFIKNLIVFKRWLYIEEVAEDRDKIREAFVRFVKPKKTICMNSLFKPYLPVDEEGFVRIENLSSALDMNYSIGLLTRAMRTAEEHTEPQANEVVIVLTDDEDEAPTNEFAHLNSDSHHSYIEDLSNDIDGQSSISTHSTYSTRTSNEIMMIDTLSIDTLPSLRSTMSTQSIDTTSMSECVNIVEESSDNSARASCVPSDIMSLNSSNDYANTNTYDVPTVDSAAASNDTIANLCHELDTGQSDVNEIPPLDQSTFNNLVQNINESQISESFANAAMGESTSVSEDRAPLSVVTRHEMSCQTTISLPIHGDSDTGSEMRRTSTEVAVLLANESVAIESRGKVNGLIEPDLVLAEAMAKDNCDTANTSISNASSLGNHQETLLQIDEILSADLNTPREPVSVENDRIASDAVPQIDDASTQITDSLADQVGEEVRPKTPAANHSMAETELLSRSEQELLFSQEKDAFEMELSSFGNDSMRDATSRPSIASPTMSIDDRPPLWMRNSINNPPKTYSKIRKEKADANKQLSTATTPKLAELSANATSRPADDEDSFLMDIFCSKEVRTRLTGSTPSGTETIYSSSTPNLPMASPAVKKNKRATRVSGKMNETQKQMKSPTKVPSPKKTTKRGENVTTKGNAKRQPKSQKKATPTRTREKPTNNHSGIRQRNFPTLDTAISRFENSPTILTRQTYVKPLNHQTSDDGDNSFEEIYTDKLHHSSTFFSSSFGRRTNGQYGLSAKKKPAPTILERKTYIKSSASNTTPSNNTSSSMQSQPYDSCSHNTSGSSTTNNNYSANATMANSTAYALKNDKARFGSVMSNESVESDYLKNLFAGDFDSSKGIRNPLPGLKLPRSTDLANASIQKRHKISSDDYSDLDDMDDSTGYNTRKSKRSRKRPKKLDL